MNERRYLMVSVAAGDTELIRANFLSKTALFPHVDALIGMVSSGEDLGGERIGVRWVELLGQSKGSRK